MSIISWLKWGALVPIRVWKIVVDRSLSVGHSGLDGHAADDDVVIYGTMIMRVASVMMIYVVSVSGCNTLVGGR